MKSKGAIFWFVVALALAGVVFAQWDSSKKQKLKMEELQLQVEKIGSREKEVTTRMQDVEKERSKLNSEVRALEFELNNSRMAYNALAQMTNTAQPGSMQAAQARAGQRPGQGGQGGIGQMLATMMKDPDTRKMLEQQQRMGMDMVYGSLFKQLKLTPEQESKLKDLLVSQQMKNMESAGAMFGDAGGEQKQELMQEVAAENQKQQEEIKELLGEDKYAQYEDYNQTIGERMMLEQFGKQAEITSEQSDQLLAIMREEKKNAQINHGLLPQDPGQDWQKMMQGNMAEQFFKQQEEVNLRVLDRAGQVLTPDQMQKFGPMLKNQLDMQRAGMKMAQQMMGGGNQEQTPPPVPAAEQP